MGSLSNRKNKTCFSRPSRSVHKPFFRPPLNKTSFQSFISLFTFFLFILNQTMSFSIEQIPSLPLLVNKKQSIYLTDSLLSELTMNQKHLISRLSRFLEFDSAYFDEETNIFIKKCKSKQSCQSNRIKTRTTKRLFIVIYFLLPNSSPWINLAELNTLEMVDASSKKILAHILS